MYIKNCRRASVSAKPFSISPVVTRRQRTTIPVPLSQRKVLKISAMLMPSKSILPLRKINIVQIVVEIVAIFIWIVVTYTN